MGRILALTVAGSVAATALLVGSATDALAVSGCPCGGVSQIVNQIVTQIANNKINPYTKAQVDRLEDIIIKHGRQMTANTETQTQGETQTIDAQTQALSKSIRDTAKAEMSVRMAPPSLPCITPTMSKQLLKAEALRHQQQAQFAQALFSWGNNMDPESKGSAGATAMNAASKSLSTYCGPAEAEQGLCTAAPAELQDANIRAGTIFDKGTMSPMQSQAAQDYLRNVTDPTPPARMSGASYQSVDGMTQLAERDSRDARISATNEVGAYIYGLKQPVATLGEWAQQNTGEDLAVDGQISIHDTLYTASVYRLRGDTWYNNMLASPSDAAIKDLAVMAATDLYVSWERFELEQREATALAALTAMLAQQNFNGNKSVATTVGYQPTSSQ